MPRKVTLLDIAHALGVSTGTVHRALHDHAGVNALTKTRVVRMAKSMGYRVNLAARYLSLKRNYRISVNTLKGFNSFWDEVRTGIKEEAEAIGMDSVEIEFRTYSMLGQSEEEAFKEALNENVDGIITFPSHPKNLGTWMRRASRSEIPVVCVSTDAPDTRRLAVVSVDTSLSGSLAADLMGRMLQGKGNVAVTLGASQITEHAEKCRVFKQTMRTYYPEMKLVAVVEDHDEAAEAYEKSKALFMQHPELSGVYVTTEASMPVLKAARDVGMLPRLTIITTDLFPALEEEIRRDSVLATIYQRPNRQGHMAFRVLHEFLLQGSCPSSQVTIAPHLVMRGNLDYFLRREAVEAKPERSSRAHAAEAALDGFAAT
ncbi:MAG: substrate-binding domain-containing protein [Candidatus Acidiferrales bacterium]